MREAALLRRVAWLEAQLSPRPGPAAQITATQRERDGVQHSAAAQSSASQAARTRFLHDGAVQASALSRHAEEVRALHPGAVLGHQSRVNPDSGVEDVTGQREQDVKGIQAAGPLQAPDAAPQEPQDAAPQQPASEATLARDEAHEQGIQAMGSSAEGHLSRDGLLAFAAGSDPQLRSQREGLPAVRTSVVPCDRCAR